MIKQILGKIPRKPSKSSSSDSSGGDGGLNSPLPPNSVNNNGLKPSSANHNSGTLSNQPYEALPSFREVPISERQGLFIKKLSLCSVVFDFSDPSANLREKDMKRQTLLELVDFVSSPGNTKLTETAMQEIVRMAAANLFRTLSSPSRESRVLEAHDLEEEEPSLELAWPHVQVVYELLLRFVASSETDAKLAKRFVDHAFVLRLLDLFDSEDQRERDYLKTILHRIYGKFMVHRPFIRKAINNIFYRFIFETEKHNGIAELLEILGSVINGFALPLKEEHKMFLARALVPLHKPRCVSAYHQQLSYCIAQFVEKDVKLTETVIRGLLKYWPVSNSSKEVMFLAELEEVLEATQEEEFRGCMVPLFRQISRCINSFHFQVAERTLFLWNNDHIRKLIIENRRVILPIVLPALERNALVHWNQAVQSLSLNVKKIFADADQAFFDQCFEEFKENEIKESETQKKRESSWKKLEEVAISEAVLVSSFVSSVTISASSTPFTAAGN